MINKPLIILDRDGVINQDSDQYIKSAQEWQPIPGSLEAIAGLVQAGYTIAIATNQSGIARGYYDAAVLAAMHAKMQRLLVALGGEVAYISYCPHGPDDGCACRKPLPGMLHTILQHYAVAAEAACFVGDSYRDYQAARAAGVAFSLVKTGKGMRTLAAHPELPADLGGDRVYAALADFARAILNRRRVYPPS